MEIYQHFNGSERDFVKKSLARVENVQRTYVPRILDFHDPREQEIIASIVKYVGDVEVVFDGGFEESERSRAYIYPEMLEASNSDYEIVIFKASYLSKFVKIEHRNVLGALLSLGIIREKMGDIKIEDGAVYFVVCEEIASFIENNLTKIGAASIKLERVSRDELPTVEEDWVERSVSVSSMRLDAIVSSITNLSRQQSQNLIESGKVKVNWREQTSASVHLNVGDVLSIRGSGRKKILNFLGQSKKGKMRIVIGELKG